MLQDVLDLASLEAGAVALSAAPFALGALLAEVTAALAPALAAHGNVLHIAPGEAALVSDYAQLRQVLWKLLDNANKFTAQGTITVSVALLAEQTPRVEITVADTGRGITAADIQRIFTPFTQADSAPTRRHDGSGLGVAFSARRCQLLGGELRVTSVLGQGSAFTVRIPTEVGP